MVVFDFFNFKKEIEMSNIKLVEIKSLVTYEIEKISKEQKCSLNKHLNEAIVYERREAEEFLWVNADFTQHSSAVIYQFGFNFEHSMEEVQQMLDEEIGNWIERNLDEVSAI